ncbi:efflux RND transporter periplasmic adaptor subunit [Aquabacterium sp. J223]|uniref:efflux RND transporter periplasmic adaptor subunit n=1 Tax=Aquabacterium sp. J223 TaxID=2898431 RepID=UPI0021ADAA57|nr:efflux RND transporter periplasmic adaptor subunit [Aquabacterium sp. J223]UUX97219.1 efflux RND transporter periplasmic adaptor subunit [Aquabacterium sp. J223]
MSASTSPLRPLAAALSLALAAALAGCSGARPQDDPPPQAEPAVSETVVSFPGQKDPPGIRIATVSTDRVQPLQVPARLTWDEDRTARLWPPFGGRLDRVLVQPGQAVRRGDRLAELASGDVGQVQADGQKAETDLRLAQAAAERARELAAGGVIAGKELQQAEADLARARAERDRSRARLSQYGVAAGQVNQSLAIAAPLAGTVVERNASPGTEVRPDQARPLFVVSDTTRLWVSIDVNETQLAAFQPGRPVTLRAAAWPDERFTATITSVADAVDPASRTVKVLGRIDNPDRRLKAEMYVTATVEQAVSAPLVPADAVFLRGDRSAAFVQLAPGRYERRDLVVRPAGPTAWAVQSGLQPGEKVVLGGGLYLDQLMTSVRR